MPVKNEKFALKNQMVDKIFVLRALLDKIDVSLVDAYFL